MDIKEQQKNIEQLQESYPGNEQVFAFYLNIYLRSGSDDEFIASLGNLTRQIGVSEISKNTGLSRTSLYKAFVPGAKPKFATIAKILKALGTRLVVESASDCFELGFFRNRDADRNVNRDVAE